MNLSPSTVSLTNQDEKPSVGCSLEKCRYCNKKNNCNIYHVFLLEQLLEYNIMYSNNDSVADKFLLLDNKLNQIQQDINNIVQTTINFTNDNVDAQSGALSYTPEETGLVLYNNNDIDIIDDPMMIDGEGKMYEQVTTIFGNKKFKEVKQKD